MVGLVDGGALGYWQIIKPQAGTNLVTNPSFEVNTTGWTPTNSTFTRTAGAGVLGAYGGRLLASAQPGYATYTTAGTVASGTVITMSCWMRSTSTSTYLQYIAGVAQGTITHPGDGAWHRLEISFTMPSTAVVSALVVDNRGSSWTNVDVDGVQIETDVSAASTYIDGDQDGCTWNGAPHASTSTRDGRDGRGGQIVSLDSVGLRITSWKGSGAPPVDVATQTLALGDGEIYQRSTAKARVLTLQGLIIGDATGLPSWHAQRRTIIDLFRPDGRTNRGPITLRYAGPTVPKRLQTLYQSGLEMDSLDAADEKPEIKMMAPQPDWQGETDEQAAVTIGQTLSPVHGFALRLPDGTWSTMAGGVAVSAPSWLYVAQQLLDGRIVVGGSNYADFGGSAAIDNLGVWDGAAWATLGGAAPNAYVNSFALGNDGTLYIGGDFTSIGGVAINRIARWSPSTNAWTTVGTAGSNVAPAVLLADPSTGYLWMGGTGGGTVGGVAIGGMGYWNGTTWVAAATGLPGGFSFQGSQSMAIGPDGRIYAGLSGGGIYVWTGAAWTLFAATTGGVYCLLTRNGRLYAGGGMTVIGGITVSCVAMTSGSGWNSMNGGTNAAGAIRTLAGAPGGLVYAAGDNWTSIGGVTPPDTLAVWNGSTWAPFGADPPNTGTHTNDLYTVYGLRDGSLLVGWFAVSGTFGTTMPTEGITTVTNTGSSNAYPVIRFDAAGTVYTIANLTTGQRINFSGCTLVSGETGTLDLRPGHKTFSTQVRSLITTVLPGSDLATFTLAPGVNRIAVMTTGGTVSMFWHDSFWSAD